MSLLSPQQQARSEVLAALGLTHTAPADWTYDQRTAYNKALAAKIVANPAGWAPESVAAAKKVLSSNYAALEGYGIGDAAKDFVSGAADGVGSVVSSVSSVGEGVKTTLNLTRWLLPLGAVVAVGILLLALFRRSGAAAQ